MSERPISDYTRLTQDRYRRRLVKSWGIEPGETLLEIGCGQGEMTRALARAVGPSGRVVAVDVADRGYGTPMTLGEATDELKVSSLGRRVEFHFEFDLLECPEGVWSTRFDRVVLAHSSWYFASAHELAAAFRKLRPWSGTLCFAEWDIEPRLLSQVPHLLAVLVQGQVEAFKDGSQANVRTPLHRHQVMDLLTEAGWTPVRRNAVDTRGLQDADWEIGACLRSSVHDAQIAGLPDKLVRLIEAEVETLRALALPRGNRPLPSYSVVLT
jgi:SAM-dependent methyltransferase